MKIDYPLYGHRLSILAIVFAIFINVNAYDFKSLSIEDGLSSSQVNAILKDSRGYMWFGTISGLSRYDGFSIKNFTKRHYTIRDSYINSIQETLDGKIWLGSPSGYMIYDPVNESFTDNMQNTLGNLGINYLPTKICVDSKKNLWAYVKNQGIFYYEYSHQLLYHFGIGDDKSSIPEGDIVDMAPGKNGFVVAYKSGALYFLSAISHQVEWANNSLSLNGVKDLDDFHIYVLERHNRKLRFYLDEEMYWTFDLQSLDKVSEPIIEQERYVIFSIQGHAGKPNEVHLPGVMLIDYVRVYNKIKEDS